MILVFRKWSVGMKWFLMVVWLVLVVFFGFGDIWLVGRRVV